ncbi:DUF3182 family protein [Xanthomonas sacchari]|uniref:DUF3182 domain-containing protein n=1 Tax=Xanthomonas sacchari TaxID=56458 RepID=A0A2P5Z3W9_9XANT|nr:DUF3182 family protein [Xanthomonas sacchari]MDV0438544.1 DUF3182 family protein [Xanthomonas sacchari]PPU82476.1 DUF3182 domain-containing protein [Xanthomonas sacchari]
MSRFAAHANVRAYRVRDAAFGGHEAATHAWVVAEVARLMRLPVHDARLAAGSDAFGSGAFYVPDETLTEAQAAQLGVQGAADLLGGVVPHAFVATKAISHPLVDGDAQAPEGWQPDLGVALASATLPGYTAFSAADARRAFARLCDGGQVRLKPCHGVGGLGQVLLHDTAALDAALSALPVHELHRHGVVLERHLQQPTTFSVGETHCAGITIAYCGTQSVTRDGSGREAYGGSELHVIRGTFDTLLAQPLPPRQRTAVLKARDYDRLVAEAYPGFYASRRNYDVIEGLLPDGSVACGVLEQSWRVGGATPAELAAVAAFQQSPTLQRVVAATVERYGAHPPPPAGAQVYYVGEEPRTGLLTKYRHMRSVT